jgi:ABC-2 type transport system permease protein
MKKLLSIEIIKLKYYKTFWIMLLAYLVISIAWNIGFANNYLHMETIMDMRFQFPFVWDKVVYIASWLIVILCILMITIMSNEYQFKTNRQHVIDGLRRQDVWLSKLIVVVGLATFIVITALITGLFLGYTHGGGNPLAHLMPLLHLFVYSINYLSVALLITVFIKKSGLSIAIFFAYFMFVESIVSHLINKKMDPIGNFLPLQVSDEMFKLPTSEMVNMAMHTEQKTLGTHWYLLGTIVYIGVYYLIIHWQLQKRDL